jgi:glycosylphosphatidylinositol transamidase (GPIT) subunit GPI8
MYYENYRHSVNSLLMYNVLRENGVPDEHVRKKNIIIILFLNIDYFGYV